ncbi:DUF58 domain-containing protein [Haloimpatiens lingqiaonensis]|uniref:DUF58 domain-containing protein n=1 Tax=Haloimpatiens lingqiaonensis TaxID=1380675 RepID=UPI0010FDDE0D|nr:DUF58 domain-containing protein [Haloimpatiens lingqiaonensis]
MISFLVFLFIIALVYGISDYTKKKGFDKLLVYRDLDRNSVVEGEKVKVSIIVENKKKMPIFFMLIKEEIPYEIMNKSYVNTTQYSIGGYEKIKKTYAIPMEVRGVYLLRKMEVIVGDLFGFFTTNKEIENYMEIVVYPKIVNLIDLKFDSTSNLGDALIKRWIYKDPLYIKGIREYNIEDRMKDIHWKSSLKMNKLMVKEYDYTSEREFITIVNIQCHEIYWRYVNKKAIDRAIKVTVSITDSALKEGVKAAAWTNANIISYSNEVRSITTPCNSLKEVLELCARMDYMPKTSFSDFLNKYIKHFKPNNTYVIISSFFTEEDQNIIYYLRNKGINLKIVDVSDKGNLPDIRGVEKIVYGGDGN